jgi:DNA-binding transcriptional MerR regulator
LGARELKLEKSPDAFRTISEAATELRVPQHVLRFWETKFTQIKPMKRAGGRRYYRPSDLDILKGIRGLLYDEGYTIRGVQRIFKEEGGGFVSSVGRGEITPRKGDAFREGAPRPGQAKVAPRRGGAVASAPVLPIDAPLGAYAIPATHADQLNAALRDLTDARKLLDGIKT